MAITKIVGAVHTSKSPAKHIGMKKLIDYILDPEKTENGRYTGSLNCSAQTALKEMIATTRHFGKDSDDVHNRLGYHFVISWSPEENVSDETAFQVISEFCERFFGKEYETVYSLHTDKEHKHGHIAFNSVNCETGRKYRYEDGDWARKIQPLVDELCQKYGLHTLEVDTGMSTEEYFAEEMKAKKEKRRKQAKKQKERTDAEGTDAGEKKHSNSKYFNEKDAPVTRTEYADNIKKLIDGLIPECRSFEELIQKLSEKGVSVRSGKYFSVRTEGMHSSVRLDKTDQAYSKEKIRERIERMREAEIPVLQEFPEEIKQKKPGVSRAEYLKYIRETVDYLVPRCRSFEDFLQKLQEMGFTVKMRGHISVQAEGMSGFARLDTIGGEYTQDRIRERIEGRMAAAETQKVSFLPAELLEGLKKYRTKEERRFYAGIYRQSLVSADASHYPTYRNVCRNAAEIKKMMSVLHEIHEKGISDSAAAAALAGKSRNALAAAKAVYTGLDRDRKKYAGLIKTYQELKQMGNGCFPKGEGSAAFDQDRIKYDMLKKKLMQYGYQYDEVKDFVAELLEGLRNAKEQTRNLERDVRLYEEIQRRFEKVEKEQKMLQQESNEKQKNRQQELQQENEQNRQRKRKNQTPGNGTESAGGKKTGRTAGRRRGTV